jgi:hypothetical protein
MGLLLPYATTWTPPSQPLRGQLTGLLAAGFGVAGKPQRPPTPRSKK